MFLWFYENVNHLIVYRNALQKVIQRHFWLKRHQVIEQARRWLADMKRDLAEAEKNPKRKESASFDAICNPYAQERVIQQLIEELTNMPCPCEYC